MKKYVMNKNVMHSGKAYNKGQEIGEGDDGFKELVKAGHANEMNFKEERSESANVGEDGPPVKVKGKR